MSNALHIDFFSAARETEMRRRAAMCDLPGPPFRAGTSSDRLFTTKNVKARLFRSDALGLSKLLDGAGVSTQTIRGMRATQRSPLRSDTVWRPSGDAAPGGHCHVGSNDA